MSKAEERLRKQLTGIVAWNIDNANSRAARLAIGLLDDLLSEHRAEVAQARDAAFEEAALFFATHRQGVMMRETVAELLRGMKESTPAQECRVCGKAGQHKLQCPEQYKAGQAVPVARVREVLVTLRDHPTSWDTATCEEVARSLGVSLDEREARCRCGHRNGVHSDDGVCEYGGDACPGDPCDCEHYEREGL